MTMVIVLVGVVFAAVVFVAGVLCGYRLGLDGPEQQKVGEAGFIDVEPAVRESNRTAWPKGFPTREDVIRSTLWRKWRYE